MQIRVETYISPGGVEMLRQFRLDGCTIDVSDNLDQWHGADYRYFKVKDEEGNLYVLRLVESEADRELIMFQSTELQALSAHAHIDPHPHDDAEERD